MRTEQFCLGNGVAGDCAAMWLESHCGSLSDLPVPAGLLFPFTAHLGFADLCGGTDALCRLNFLQKVQG